MPKLGSFGTGSLRPSGFQGIPTQSPTGQFVQTTPGSYTWKVPANVTKVNILLLGGGGGGGGQGRNASGGGGGSLTYANNVPVSPNSVISYQVGAGGSVNGDGGISWFNNSTYLYANGGSKGTAVATNAAGEATYTVSTAGGTSYTTSYSLRTTGSTTGALGTYYLNTWTCPEGVWSISVALVSAGGGGGPSLTDTVGGVSSTSNLGGVGGQGGGFSYRNNLSVIPGTVYLIHIGSRGNNNTSSPTSWTTTTSGTMGGDSIFFNVVGIYATAVTSGTYITMNDVSNLQVNATIVFTGATSYGGIETPNVKYIITSVNATNKTIQVKKTYGSGVSSITSFTNNTGFNLSAVSTTIMASGGVPGHGLGTTPAANATIAGGSGTYNIRFGTSGADGGRGGVPTTSSRIGGGGGGAGGYSGVGGNGGAPSGNTGAAGATGTGGSGGGGSSGAYKTAITYTVSTTGQTGSGSSTLLWINSTPALTVSPVGATVTKVSGTGAFAAGTTITQFTANSWIQLSAQPTTTFTSGATFTINVTGYSGGGGGGGVELQGSGTAGAATTAPVSSSNPTVYAGRVGSDYTPNVSQNTTVYQTDPTGASSQMYGGGGGGASARSSDIGLGADGGTGGSGAVRIIWAGSKDVSSTTNATVSPTVAYATSGYQGGGGGGAAGYAGNGGRGGSAYPSIDTVGGAGGWEFTGTPVGDETFSFFGGGGGGSFTGASSQGYWPAEAATGGSGAGGGGSAQTDSLGTQAYGGGGVSYLGQSSVNSAGNATTAGPAKTAGQSAGAATNGGSGGMDGTSSAGGSYGGGGAGGYNGGIGQGGFFRVIWGEGRRYPSTFTQDLVQAGGFTSGLTYKIAVLGSTSQNQWNILAGTTGSPITYDVGQTFTAANITGSYGSGSAYLA